MKIFIKVTFLTTFWALYMLGLQSCYKHAVNVNSTDQTVKTSIYGIVDDEAGLPVAGAFVKCGAHTAYTDDNGLFFFKDILCPSRSTVIVVTKTGYFNGARTFAVHADDIHSVKISLMGRGFAQSFNAGIGAQVNFDGGVSITFSKNSIVNASNGTLYSGQVKVYAKSIDPTTALGLNTMPGTLKGIDNSGKEHILQSFGMMVVELYDDSGQKLQIAKGSSAVISQIIPPSLLGIAKATIPLWYFDETQGIWIEDGKAQLKANRYEGTVTHFTYWNYDAQAPAINIEMAIQDQNGNPIQGAYVTLHSANSIGSYGYSSANGWLGGLTEANAQLNLNIYINAINPCGGANTIIYSSTVTTGANNMNLGVVTVNLNWAGACVVNATLQNCVGAPISNSLLYMPAANAMLIPNALGQVSYTMNCLPAVPIELYAYDLSTNDFGKTTFVLQSGINNLGVLSACGSQSLFLSVHLINTATMDTTLKLLNSFSDVLNCTVQGNNSALAAVGFMTTITMAVDGTGTGTFNITNGHVHLPAATTDTLTYAGGGSIEFTKFQAAPGFVTGKFIMNFIGSPSGALYAAIGNFQHRRIN